MRIICFIFCF